MHTDSTPIDDDLDDLKFRSITRVERHIITLPPLDQRSDKLKAAAADYQAEIDKWHSANDDVDDTEAELAASEDEDARRILEAARTGAELANVELVDRTALTLTLRRTTLYRDAIGARVVAAKQRLARLIETERDTAVAELHPNTEAAAAAFHEALDNVEHARRKYRQAAGLETWWADTDSAHWEPFTGNISRDRLAELDPDMAHWIAQR